MLSFAGLSTVEPSEAVELFTSIFLPLWLLNWSSDSVMFLIFLRRNSLSSVIRSMSGLVFFVSKSVFCLFRNGWLVITALILLWLFGVKSCAIWFSTLFHFCLISRPNHSLSSLRSFKILSIFVLTVIRFGFPLLGGGSSGISFCLDGGGVPIAKFLFGFTEAIRFSSASIISLGGLLSLASLFLASPSFFSASPSFFSASLRAT